jgi:hypothetical protein
VTQNDPVIKWQRAYGAARASSTIVFGLMTVALLGLAFALPALSGSASGADLTLSGTGLALLGLTILLHVGLHNRMRWAAIVGMIVSGLMVAGSLIRVAVSGGGGGTEAGSHFSAGRVVGTGSVLFLLAIVSFACTRAFLAKAPAPEAASDVDPDLAADLAQEMPHLMAHGRLETSLGISGGAKAAIVIGLVLIASGAGLVLVGFTGDKTPRPLAEHLWEVHAYEDYGCSVTFPGKARPRSDLPAIPNVTNVKAFALDMKRHYFLILLYEGIPGVSYIRQDGVEQEAQEVLRIAKAREVQSSFVTVGDVDGRRWEFHLPDGGQGILQIVTRGLKVYRVFAIQAEGDADIRRFIESFHFTG